MRDAHEGTPRRQDAQRAPRVRLLFAALGVAIALVAYLGAADVDPFVLALLAFAVVPYALYVAFVQTRLLSLLGGVALLILPVLAYGDFYLDRYRGVEHGVNFGFVTVPMANLGIVAGALVLDQVAAARRRGHGPRPRR